MTDYPHLYDPVIAADLLKRHAEGETLGQICKTPGYPSKATIYNWEEADIDGFRDLFARARMHFYYGYAEEIVDIGETSVNDYMKREIDAGRAPANLDKEHIERTKLRLDTRKWVLGKMLPKIYGPKAAVVEKDDSGKDGQTFILTVEK